MAALDAERQRSAARASACVGCSALLGGNVAFNKLLECFHMTSMCTLDRSSRQEAQNLAKGSLECEVFLGDQLGLAV